MFEGKKIMVVKLIVWEKCLQKKHFDKQKKIKKV